MIALPFVAYPLIALATLSITLILTPLALQLARRWRFLDHPGQHKTQEDAVPYLGGAAIVVAFVVVVLGAAMYRPPHNGVSELALLLGVALGLSLIGLVDDIRNVSPWLRIVAEIAAGLAVCATGTTLRLTVSRLGAPHEADTVLTVIWIVGVTNAFNLLDNMDGLSAGVAAIASVAFFVVAQSIGQFLVATLAIALAGCALGFLRHNFHPARIYMGDSGSLFLGFLLAVLGLRLRTHITTRVTLFVPIVILGVALLDTSLVTITRLLHHRNPMMGGRDHISHRLVFVGIPVRASVGLIYAAAIALAWLGIVMAWTDRLTSILLMGLVLSVAGFVGILLAMIPVYEQSKRRHLMLTEVRPHETQPTRFRHNEEGTN